MAACGEQHSTAQPLSAVVSLRIDASEPRDGFDDGAGVGLAFAGVSIRYGVLSESGARVRMLYFARVRDGRTSE